MSGQSCSSRERRYSRCSDPELSPRAGLGCAAIIAATVLSAAGHRVRRPPSVGERPVHRAHGGASCPLRGSSRRTAIRVSPRSRTLASSPCSAGWSVSRPKMTVSSPSPLTCRPSNQSAHRLSRTPATRISYGAGPPEAVTLAPQSCGQEWPSPRQPPAAAGGGAGHGLFPGGVVGNGPAAGGQPGPVDAGVQAGGPARSWGTRLDRMNSSHMRTCWSWRAHRVGVASGSPHGCGQAAGALGNCHQDHLVGLFSFTGHSRSGRQGWASAEGVPVRWNLRRPVRWYEGAAWPTR